MMEFISFKNEDYEKYAKPIVSTVYAHGKLENVLGYDCCGVSEIDEDHVTTLEQYDKTSSNFLDIEGIFDVSVKGVDKTCVGYFWVARRNNRFIVQKGLIVFKDDAEGNAYAREKYEAKPMIV